MNFCYRCKDLLSHENKSIEHIIPNALGGKLKSSNLLCKSCNSLYGQSFDFELCKQLNPLASLLNIKREKGEVPHIKNVISESGKRYHLKNGLTPVPIAPEIRLEHDRNLFYVSARNEKEIRHIISKLKEKYPSLDDTNLEQKFRREKEFLNESVSINLSIGGEHFYKAIVKIAVNYYLFSGGDISVVDYLIKRLDTSGDLFGSIVSHYYIEDIFSSRPDEVIHSILVKADIDNKVLYGYLELFSGYSFIILLNTNYDGKEVNFQYDFDVLKCKSVKRNLPKALNWNLLKNRSTSDQQIQLLQAKILRICQIADERHISEIVKDIVEDSMKKTFQLLPEGAKLTEENLKTFVKELDRNAAPFIQHIYNKKAKHI